MNSSLTIMYRFLVLQVMLDRHSRGLVDWRHFHFDMLNCISDSDYASTRALPNQKGIGVISYSFGSWAILETMFGIRIG